MPFWVWLAFQETPGSARAGRRRLGDGAVIADVAGDNRARKQIGYRTANGD